MLGALFAKRMAEIGGFESCPHVAVAVSGGSDSVALLALTRDWALVQGGRVSALTVDHRLRADSGAEALRVGRLAALWGIEHHCLTLERAPGPGNIMASARLARYRILEEWCQAQSVLHLFLGHQRDDQAETFLLRLGRGSGLRGLKAMRAVDYRSHLRLLRPLLDVARSDLIDYCRTRGWPILDDPSNSNEAFARARMRRLLPALSNEGLTTRRLGETAFHLARADDTISEHVVEALAYHSRLHPGGFARLSLEGWRLQPREVRLRMLSGLVQWVGGGDHAPRFKSLARLALHLMQSQGGATLAGCRLVWRRAWLWIGREAANMALAQKVAPGETLLWDGRFAIDMPENGPLGWTIGPLGVARPWRAPPKSAIPQWLWPTLPCWRHLDVVTAVPHLKYRLVDDRVENVTLPFLTYRSTVRLDGGFTVETACERTP